MTTLTRIKSDGTLDVENPAVKGDTPVSATSFRIASLRRDWTRDQGTEISRFWFVHGVELTDESSRPSVGFGGELIGREKSEYHNYSNHAFAFPSEGVDDSIVIQADFDRLADELKSETAHLSSAAMIAGHRAFQEIIGMGQAVIPLILRDLEHAPTHWFLALRAITRESPVQPEDRGNVRAMSAAWISWGERRRYIEP